MTAGDKTKVLIADDSDVICNVLSLFMSGEIGFEVVGRANNGAKALELSKQLSPDVVIMDVNMPVMNGIEATKHILNHNPDTKVIGYSFRTDDEASGGMFAAGACAFLHKSCKTEELVSVIKDVTSQKQSTS